MTKDENDNLKISDRIEHEKSKNRGTVVYFKCNGKIVYVRFDDGFLMDYYRDYLTDSLIKLVYD